jgi:hypothetical protein
MPSSGMLRCVALVRADVSGKLRASVIKVTIIGERRLVVTANFVPRSPILITLMMEELRSSETTVLTSAPQRNIPAFFLFCKLGVPHTPRNYQPKRNSL